MKYKDKKYENLCIQQDEGEVTRVLNPSDINVPQGYSIDVFAEGLDAPIEMLFINDSDILIADAGSTSGNGKVMLLRDGNVSIIAEGFIPPLLGIAYREGNIYVSHKGYITVIRSDGMRENIISGLPSYGDYSNTNIIFGPDNKLYFGMGSATNSGVVGRDNTWIYNYPEFHDYPGDYIILNGQNFESVNAFSLGDEQVLTGAFAPYGTQNLPFEKRKGVTKATGSILRSNTDGTGLELVAWGFRNPARIRFSNGNQLFAANHGYDYRGSRPIANAVDELFAVQEGIWYGWPDFTNGELVNSSRFIIPGGPNPELLLNSYPNQPPRPYAIFPHYSTIMGFDFNISSEFGNIGDIYIAEFGRAGLPNQEDPYYYVGVGHRISRIDVVTRGITTFAINHSGFPSLISGEGGFGSPIDVKFGPDGAMYIVDMGIQLTSSSNLFRPNTGVIWRIRRSSVEEDGNNDNLI